MISLVPYFAKAINNNYSSDIMAEWIFSFFDNNNGASINSEYNAAAGAGSAKPVTIQIRNKVLDESFGKFFDTNETEIPEREDVFAEE